MFDYRRVRLPEGKTQEWSRWFRHTDLRHCSGAVPAFFRAREQLLKTCWEVSNDCP